MYRIMLADDEGIVVDSFTYILKEEFGDEVMIESAKTGRSVIELAERFRPDIALMDIRMPGINGIDAIKEIRKRNTGIIFIVISAYDKFGYAQEAINQGVMDYLNKPVDRNQLIMTVKKAMEQVNVEREKRSRELEILEKMETVTPIIESGLIYNMLFQDLFKEDLENFKKILEIESREKRGDILHADAGEAKTHEELHGRKNVGVSKPLRVIKRGGGKIHAPLV